MSFYGKQNYNYADGGTIPHERITVDYDQETEESNKREGIQPVRDKDTSVKISFGTDEFMRFGTVSISYATYCLISLVVSLLTLLVSCATLRRS